MARPSHENDRTKTAGSSRLVDSDVGGFYLWPPSWIVERPQMQGEGQVFDALSRTVFTFTFDCGIKLKASAQGYFVFDFANCSETSIGEPTADWPGRLYVRMRFMNLYLVYIYTALTRLEKINVEKHYVDEASYFAARSFEVNPYRASCDMRQLSQLEKGIEIQTPLPPFLTVYPEKVLKAASDLTNNSYATSGDESVVIGDLLLQAFNLHEGGHFETSQIVAWGITERCLNQLWSTHITASNDAFSTDSSRPFINSDRRGKLNGRDFSASVISEILSLAGVIDFDTYDKLNRARRDRNNWLHKMKRMDKQQSVASLNLAIAMLRKARLIDAEFFIELVKTPHLSLTKPTNEKNA